MEFTNLTTAEYEAARWDFALQLEEGGTYKALPYTDTKGIPTIGAGFNLQVDANLNAILETFGFNLSDPLHQTYRNQLDSVFNSIHANNTALRSAANDIMEDWSTAVGGGRTVFEFVSEAEAITVYEEIIAGYENETDDYIGEMTNYDESDFANSFERLALLDLSYNGLLYELVEVEEGVWVNLPESEKLLAAIDADDRAEAWYEITFNSNYGDSRSGGIFKRRIVEGELFGLYEGEADPSWETPEESEALQVFRMLSKHEKLVAGELSEWSSAWGIAQGDWNALESGGEFKGTTIESINSDDWLSGVFEPAANVLKDTYLVFVDMFQDVAEYYSDWYSEFEALIDYEISGIFVAAETQGNNGYLDGLEVAARTVDRSQDGSENDLLFSGIESTSGQNSYDLISGDGDDVVIVGEGEDAVDGGDGFDGVSLVKAESAQTLNFDSGQHSGSVVSGDTYTNIEYFIGSAYGDTVTGGEDDLIFFGGDGDDTITGGDGNDILIGGGAINFNIIDGGAGDDDIWGGTAEDQLTGGDDYDYVIYLESNAGVNFNFQSGVGTGTGGYAQGDTVEGFETITGSNYADNLTNWSNAGASSAYDNFWFEGQAGDDTVSWIGDGILGFEGGVGADALTVSDAPNEAWVFFIGDAGADEVYIEENVLLEFAGGGGADKLYATSPQSSGTEPSWTALGSAVPIKEAFVGYWEFEDASDKTVDRFYLDDWELSFDLSETDFANGNYGEYLFYSEYYDGSIQINYQGDIGASGQFEGDAYGDIAITMLLSPLYEDENLNMVQDFTFYVEDESVSLDLVSFDVIGFEQGDYGISFDIPSSTQSSSSSAQLISLSEDPMQAGKLLGDKLGVEDSFDLSGVDYLYKAGLRGAPFDLELVDRHESVATRGESETEMDISSFNMDAFIADAYLHDALAQHTWA